MKPYGREKKLQGHGKWKVDYHIHQKGLVNWWENICQNLTRGRIKQLVNKQIKEDIDE